MQKKPLVLTAERLGEKKGYKKGKINGILEGMKKEKIEISKKLKELVIEKEKIINATGLSEEKIESL